MKTASSSEIKQELNSASAKELLALCMRLARFKKENKELLSYLLFEANDLPGYIENIKKEMDEQFSEVNRSSLYLAKKSIRKILRTTNKYIKYTASKETEVILVLHFCSKLRSSGIRIDKSPALTNLYNNQLKKIILAVSSLHGDLQYDYSKQIELLL